MRWLLLGVASVALAGCGKAPDARSDEAVDAGPPAIGVTAAPGVAFTYRYGFRLPSAAIAAVQETHARACERLGVARCRITGMRYRLIGENDIEGELQFRLAPELARGFGQQGIGSAAQAGGRLVDAQIAGTDAGAAIAQNGAARDRAATEVRRLDDRLAATRSAAERAELQAQRSDAAERVAAAGDEAAAARDTLAATPVTFVYESGPAVRGFDWSAPFTSAVDTALASAQVTLAVVLAVLAVLGPPAALALLVLLAVRAIRQRRAAHR